MKNENKDMYYGIVFLFLYETIFRICERLITTIALYFSWNIYIIPILLVPIAISMLFVFLRCKSAPIIKLWGVIAIIIFFLGISFIAPEQWLNSGEYSPSETVKMMSLRTTIIGGFRWIVVIIAYIKYCMLNKKYK